MTRGIRVVALLAVIALVLLAWQTVGTSHEPAIAAVRSAPAVGPSLIGDARASAAVETSARVWIEPEDQPVAAGETFTVTVMVEGAVDLAGYEFDLGYDPDVLQGLDAEDAGFLGSTGRTVNPMEPDIDNVEGLLTFAAFSTSTTEPGVDGTGALAVITMQASVPAETSAVRPRRVELFDTDGQPYERVDFGSWRIFLPLVLRN